MESRTSGVIKLNTSTITYFPATIFAGSSSYLGHPTFVLMKPNLNRWIRDYFGFSSSESRGFLVLLFVIAGLLLTPFLLDFLPDKVPPANDSQKLDSVVAQLEVSTPEEYPYEIKEKHSRRSDYHSEKAVSVRLFPFNPNTISAEQWQQLGLPRWMAERILKYRAKGGAFRKKEDLLRIYDFPRDTYQKLEPYIQLPELANTKSSDFAPSPSLPASTLPYSTSPKREKLTRFDLNEADTSQLKKVYGIGSKLASRIIRFRDNLGGFVREEQIREVWGLDSTVVLELLKHGHISNPTTIRKIRINEVKAEEFRHPYLKPYVAKAIMAYRNQHGAFRSVADLKAVKLLDEQTLKKLEPYLAY